MSISTDGSLGLKKETVYGTSVTPDHFLEIQGNPKYKWDPKFIQGKGLRPGRALPRMGRRAIGEQAASGEFTVELATKGMGVLFEAAMGVGASALVSGSTYQQLFTHLTDDYMPSYTHQVGVPQLGGAVKAKTYLGGVVNEWELNCPRGDYVTLRTAWLFRQLRRDIALAAPSYPSGIELFRFDHGTLYVGGTLTMPTSTALGSCTGTPVANIVDWNLKGSNALDGAGFNMGGAGLRTRKPAVGQRTIGGKMTAEYDGDALEDAYIAQTDLAMLLTLSHQSPLSTGTATVQIAIRNIRLDGEVANPGDGSPVTQSIDFTGGDDLLAATQVAIAIRTAETAIV